VVIGVFFKETFKIPYLPVFLNGKVVFSTKGQFSEPVTTVAGWGLRPTSIPVRHYAQQHQLPYLALEDGFLRSVGLGNQDPPLSLIADDLGIYYDATSASRLESLIPTVLTDSEIARTHALIASWRASRVSKYNHLREYSGELPARYVLVVDQTLGDASIDYGLANLKSFQQMLEAALQENPDCTVLVKIHPDVFAGRKQGHFDVKALSALPRVVVLAEDVHPVRLLEFAEKVYVVTSQMGFEALLWGKPVRTFGMPFYAGWGLAKDELLPPQRRQALIQKSGVSLLQLIHAALIVYPRYINPETGHSAEVEQVLTYIAFQRQCRNRYPATIYALNFSYWKKSIVRSFFQGSEVKFIRKLTQVPKRATLLVWGNQPLDLSTLQAAEIKLLRLEDGFLRSVGLGADLIRPLSWVIDSRGLYFDATQSSDLEYLLQTSDFSPTLLERAKTLRETIVQQGLTKYNVGSITESKRRLSNIKQHAAGRKIILVPGQVETDASLAYGAPKIHRNLELLQAVRAANPHTYIIYKPHPDVVAGLRAKGENEDQTQAYCDEMIMNIAMGELLPHVDEVYLLTSLAGFEALLRGKKVTCYGQPFYAGWGLTTDIVPIERRTRRLCLDELVAATLILYPTYISRVTHHYTTAEQALEELLLWRTDTSYQLPFWRKALRPLLRLTGKR
jgi:capsular polysaccharide export protein